MIKKENIFRNFMCLKYAAIGWKLEEVSNFQFLLSPIRLYLNWIWLSDNCKAQWLTLNVKMYTQTKKKRPNFMVPFLSIQLRSRNKNKTKMFIKRRTHKNR